jgi:integrase/recombinase XerC
MTGASHDIAGYLQYLQTQRKLSAHTLDSYQRDLAQLTTMAKERPGQMSLASLSQFDIRRFASQLHARGMSPSSIARKLSAWRGFFSWLAMQQTLAANPVDGVKAPKRAKSLPKALGVDDAVKLVSTKVDGEDEKRAQSLCSKAMFELLYSSGLRVSELTCLDTRYAHEHGHQSLGWIDLDAAELTVTGKGGKRRSVPVGAAAMQALREWLDIRGSVAREAPADDTHALFLSARGHRISPREVQKRIKAHAQAIGIPADVHPHVLRHSFASHVLQSSGDLRAVQEMLGHASISSTQVYTSLDFQRLAQVYDAAHPRAKKQGG